MKSYIQYADQKLLKIPHVARKPYRGQMIYLMRIKINHKKIAFEYYLDATDASLFAKDFLDLRHEDDPNVNEMTDEAAEYMQAVADGRSVVGEWYIGPVVMHRELLLDAEKAKSIERPWKWMKFRLIKVEVVD